MPNIDLQLDSVEERYGGIYSPPWMQALIDAVCRESAQWIPAPYDDYQTCDVALLPVYAVERDAINYTELLGEQHARDSLEVSDRLWELAGTPESWFAFCRSVQSVGTLSYSTGGSPTRRVGVDLFISPPLEFAVDADFLNHVAFVARALLIPYTLILNAVHVLNRFVLDNHVAVMAAQVRVARIGRLANG